MRRSPGFAPRRPGSALVPLGRLALFGLLGLTALAVALEHRTSPPRRSPAFTRYAVFDAADSPGDGGGPRVLDLETGRAGLLGLPSGDRLFWARSSPWRDAQGHCQIVGTWSGSSGLGTSRVVGESGLGRFTFPGGEPLDRVRFEVAPSGPPCWFPGLSARVLFPASDGRLYRLAFEEPGDDGRGVEVTDPRPTPLRWQVRPPGGGRLILRDPSWLTGPGSGPRVVVALSSAAGSEGGLAFPAFQLWWLSLNRNGDAIEAVGRLARPFGSDRLPSVVDELCPVATAPAVGRPTLIYLARPPEGGDYRLCVTPVRFDPQTEDPWVVSAEARVLAEGCFPSQPVLSCDGLRVYYASRSKSGVPETRSVELAGAGDVPNCLSMRTGKLQEWVH
jgi:hypothetical protein